MPNTLLTISMITRKTMSVLHNAIVFSRNVDRGYDNQFAIPGAKIGTTLRIRHPTRYVVTDGPTFVQQDSTDKEEILVVATQKHVGMGFTQLDLLMSVDEFSERYIEPAGNQLAGRMDRDGLLEYQNVWNSVRTPGVTSATFKTFCMRRRSCSRVASGFLCLMPSNAEEDGHRGSRRLPRS